MIELYNQLMENGLEVYVISAFSEEMSPWWRVTQNVVITLNREGLWRRQDAKKSTRWGAG
jgi:hypothetical protein